MSEISNKKAGAKFVVSENGDVVYEVELDDGKVKKVLAKDALKEIYKYMHGKNFACTVALMTAVWPDKNHQMSIKVAQIWFH